MSLPENKKDRAIAWGLFAATWLVGSSLLWFGGKTLSSPDETAVLITAKHMASAYNGALEEPLVAQAGWLHPRSWVSQGEVIVPVGFLGWPWVLSLFIIIFGTALTKWVSVGIAASIVPAMYVLLRKAFSRPGSLLGILVLLCYPPFQLYLNRSLFPNPSIIAAVLWLTYAMQSNTKLDTNSTQLEKRSVIAKYFVSGVLFALICIIRPIELFWIGPWLLGVLAAQGHLTKKSLRSLLRQKTPLCAVIAGLMIVLLPMGIITTRTYGAPWRIGYFLRDNSVSLVGTDQIVSEQKGQSVVSLFAFGVHPRNIWWNIKSFALGYALPWTIVLTVISLYYLSPWIQVSIKYRKKLRSVWKEIVLPDYRFIAAALGLGLLVAYYGNGLYQDHIRPGSITVGNSFLRYLLPVALLSAWAVAWCFDRIDKQYQKALIIFVACVSLFGGYHAILGDDEAIVSVIRSTRLNDQTREKTAEVLPQGAIVFSDRSDKIFFPDYRAVSPMPPIEQISKALEQIDTPSAYYSRPLSQKQKDEWRAQGMQLEELFAFDRFVLYRIQYLR